MKGRVLITAGGTKVRIDDVRCITNFSKGKFGFAIAKAFIQEGWQVTLLGSRELIDREKLVTRETSSSAYAVPFDYFEDFQDSLFRLIEEEHPDIVVMAAAVSDWLVQAPQTGKLDSKKSELFIRCVPAPKLIASLRERCGVKTFLTGFKLLSGAPHKELMQKAHEQVRGHRLNLTVANDLSTLQGGNHSVTLVTPEGGEIPIHGAREATAEKLVEFILRRYDVHWAQSTQGGDVSPISWRNLAHEKARKLIQFSKCAHIYCGTDGNLSWRVQGKDGFLVSPRQVRKEDMEPSDLVYVEAKLDKDPCQIIYHGARKSSIDSVVQAQLYQQLPRVHGFLHVHASAGIVIPDATTSFPYPCGAREEGDEVLSALKNIGRTDPPFAVELLHHGYLIGLEDSGADRLMNEWRKAEKAYVKHLEEVGQAEELKHYLLQPIIISGKVAGIIATHTRHGYASCFLMPAWRKSGYGERLMEELNRRGQTVIAHNDCKVTDYYISHGWRVTERDGAYAYLVPPSKRDDVQIAASLCLVLKDTRQVLLGLRKTKTWNGFWAFPGGAQESTDYDNLEAAWRETFQETGIPSLRYVYRYHDRISTYVGTGMFGERAYHVTTYIYFVDRIPYFHSSEEMDPQIHDLDTAIQTLPMGRGTKRVLRQVQEILKGEKR